MTIPRMRFTLRRMIAVVAFAGLVCAGVRWLSPVSPVVAAMQEKAKMHGQQARLWKYYAKISAEGVTTLEPGSLSNGTHGEILAFHHFVPRPRPKDPAQAEVFDRECMACAAKCQRMENYHEQLRKKWAYAASHPSSVIPRDPPPPLPIEPSHFQDTSY